MLCVEEQYAKISKLWNIPLPVRIAAKRFLRIPCNKQAKYVSVAERLALRQMQSALVLAELRRKLLTWNEQLLPKHPWPKQ
jgi:hypothetical protein